MDDPLRICLPALALVILFPVVGGMPQSANASPSSLQAQLVARLQNARGGEVITLGKNNYGQLALRRRVFNPPLVISGGRFTSVYLDDVTGLTLRQFDVTFTPDQKTTSNSQAVRIINSKRIVLETGTIAGGLAVNGVSPQTSAGKLDGTGNVKGLPTGKGVNIERSSDIVLSNLDISRFHKAITFADAHTIRIERNLIHDLRTTPISGGGVQNLTVIDNRTHTSRPWRFGGPGDHGDMLHIWTIQVPSRGIRITGNKFLQGSGQAMLGIYLDDNGRSLGFPNAIITGNMIHNSNGQGIRLERVSGTVANNSLWFSGQGDPRNAPRILVTAGTHDLKLTSNVSAGIDIYGLTASEKQSLQIANNVTTLKPVPQAPGI